MKKVTLRLLSIFLILGILLTGCKKEEHSTEFSDKSLEQSPEKRKIMQEYLKENYWAIDLEDENEFKDLAIMDSDLEGKEIFFTAELHGTKANEQLNTKFLKYFKEKTDFKYYLCELPFSDTYFINKYLDTGDIKILEDIYKPLKGTFAWTKDGYNLWKKLYEYNNTLPKDRRIQVVGVDIEHQPINAYRFLVDVLPETDAPEEIKAVIDKIKSTFNDLDKFHETFAQCSKELQKDIEKKENIYKEYLDENFTGFNLVNLNVLNLIETYKYEERMDWNNARDKMMYENFQILQKELPKGKYYGQWGLDHTFQSKEKDKMLFAAYLNSDDSIFKDKIFTLIYNYDNCEKMDISAVGSYPTSGLKFVYPQIKETNDLLEGDLNIYKLTGKDSPFSETPMYYTNNNLEELEASMLDFFQYIVCIRNSKATEPLNDDYN